MAGHLLTDSYKMNLGSMQTSIADFPITSEREVLWASQRTRLLGTLAGLQAKKRNDLAKAVSRSVHAFLTRPYRATIQFSVGSTQNDQFVEVAIIGKSTVDYKDTQDADDLRELVQDLSIDLNDVDAAIIKLSTSLDQEFSPLSADDIAEWGTMLATRTTEGALVAAQRRLREIRESSDITTIPAEDPQIHELLSLVASTTDNSVVIMSSKGQVQWINDSFSRTTGYELEEVIDKQFSDLLIGPESDLVAQKDIHSAIKFSHGISRDLLRYRKNGEKYWELVNITPVFNKAGNATHWVSIGTDITARRFAEENLTHAKAIAESANKAKSNFLANMSHEIRTPMNAVLGMTDLALSTSLTDEQHEYLSIVKDSAIALMGLLNDILDLSKIEAGKLVVDNTSFNMIQLIEYSLKPFEKQSQLKGLKFVLNVQDNTPTNVVGDPVRFRQILVNLVSNAVKFTSHGQITINLESQWETENEVSLHLSVVDTGIGMTNDALKRVFDSFTQADNSITREYGGTGLGLTISARLVDLLKGRIWVQSQENQGSTFHVSIPFNKASDCKVKDHASNLESYEFVKKGNDEVCLRILIADDNEANCLLASRILEKRGHEIETVTNGREALKAYYDSEFDVAIIDVQMPEFDGFSVTSAIRRDEASTQQHLPLIAMTAHAMTGDRERCLDAGMDAYISKPVDAQELYETVERLGGIHDIFDADIVSSIGIARNQFQNALSRLEGDEELLRGQMQYFIEGSPSLMDQMLAGLEESDPEQVRIAAHRLKGLAGTIDGIEIVELAGKIEQMSLSDTLEDITDVIDELAAVITRLTDQVNDFLST